MPGNASVASPSHAEPTVRHMADLFQDYPFGRAWDEMFSGPGVIRPAYESVHAALQTLSAADLKARADIMGRTFLDQGITFALGGVERPFPLDLIPRIVTAQEWKVVADRRAAAGPRAGGLPGRLLRTRPHLRRRSRAAPTGDHVAALPPPGVRHGRPGRRPHRHLGCRPDPRRARRVPGAGGQRPGAVGGFLRAGEPAGGLAGAVRGRWRSADPFGGRISGPAAGRSARRLSRRTSATRRWSCSPPASTTPPTSSTRCWPARWASSWSRAET